MPLMISRSLYKAYLIVFEFMHMKYEATGIDDECSVPVGLLIWAIIPFCMKEMHGNITVLLSKKEKRWKLLFRNNFF